MKLSIIHPSRSRPQQSRETINSWLIKASCEAIDNNQIELIISIDSDDPSKEEYYNLYPYHAIIQNRNKSAIEAINVAARKSIGDILIAVSDDSYCLEEWDVQLIKALSGKSGVLKTFDGVQKYICTMPIMTRDYYESKGYIYHPNYRHMFCDTHLTHVADLEGKLIIRNDLVFPHNHYSTGKSKKDALNIKNDSTWEQGEEVYLKWCRETSKTTDIFNVSKEAKQAGHINWLKKKLNVR